MICTRCEGTGFLDASDVVPDEIYCGTAEDVLDWIKRYGEETDARVCDCCGNGETWHGEPGHHYSNDDPPGRNGPYAYNGGLCECD